MKNIKLHSLFFLGLLAFSSCKNTGSDREETDVQAQFIAAGRDFEEQTDSQADYEAFKMKMNERVAENELKLAELKTRASGKTKDEKLTIAKKIAKLEVRNNELKNRLINYSKYDSATWESFKTEVEKNSATLQAAIDGLYSEQG